MCEQITIVDRYIQYIRPPADTRERAAVFHAETIGGNRSALTAGDAFMSMRAWPQIQYPDSIVMLSAQSGSDSLDCRTPDVAERGGMRRMALAVIAAGEPGYERNVA